MRDLWLTKWHWDRIFSEYLRFPLSLTLGNAQYPSLTTCCSYQKDKWAKPGNLPESNALSELGEHWKENLVFQALKLVINASVCRVVAVCVMRETVSVCCNGLGSPPPSLPNTHTHTHTRWDSSESVTTPSHRPPLPTEHTTNTRDEHPCLQRDSNPQSL